MEINESNYKDIRRQLPLFVAIKKETLDFNIEYKKDDQVYYRRVREVFSPNVWYICTKIKTFKSAPSKIYVKILGYKMLYESIIFDIIDNKLLLPN